MEENNMYYTTERNAQIVISLLKAHNIKKIVASPGTTNICLIASLQHDPFFEIYSSVDERSAGYIACGLAAESGEPVVLSCTGATASRNYMSALTEAYYRKLPILVITSSRRSIYIGHNIDQITDRTVLPNDVVKLSVQMPLVHDNDSEWADIISANKAMLELNHHGCGPVHINLETAYSFDFSVRKLTKTQAIFRYENDKNMPDIPLGRVAIHVGTHLKWSEELTRTVETFCEKYNAIVVCDQTSNYKGKYKIFANFAAQQELYTSIIKKVDLLIDLGYITASKYKIDTKEVWRVNPDGEIRDTFKKMHYIFEMEEYDFFKYYIEKENKTNTEFWQECCKEEEMLAELQNQIIERLPFSNIWIASQTAKSIPENSILYLGIQNSLRSWNFFDVLPEVTCYSNTGGYGIDGIMSSALGTSLVSSEKLNFCILGDLSFFYDMNVLGNRHVSNNLRIMVINNGEGVEFKLPTNPGAMFGNDTGKFISAKGHYGNKSSVLVKHYAEDLGFSYISASSKEEYLRNVEVFVSVKVLDKPIIFEVFTKSEDDVEALQIMRRAKDERVTTSKDKVKCIIKGVLGEKGTNTIKSFLNKD